MLWSAFEQQDADETAASKKLEDSPKNFSSIDKNF